jgi:hypothetical protein
VVPVRDPVSAANAVTEARRVVFRRADALAAFERADRRFSEAALHLRAIAGALGVGKSTVSDDLDEDADDEGMQVSHGETPACPEVTAGLDGKPYPARRRGRWANPDTLTGDELTGARLAVWTACRDWADARAEFLRWDALLTEAVDVLARLPRPEGVAA